MPADPEPDPDQSRLAGAPSTDAAGHLDIDLITEAGDWSAIGDAEALAAEVAGALAASGELPYERAIATVILSADADVQALNKEWRGKDKPTNVLSFPLPEPPSLPPGEAVHLGDVILAAETVMREAGEMGITPGAHTRHLVLHGLLHLLGFDHETDAEANEMEFLETRILATLGIDDPHADTLE